jgi:hypothetical protein
MKILMSGGQVFRTEALPAPSEALSSAVLAAGPCFFDTKPFG